MVEDKDAFDQDNVGRVDVGELVLHPEKRGHVINCSLREIKPNDEYLLKKLFHREKGGRRRLHWAEARFFIEPIT